MPRANQSQDQQPLRVEVKAPEREGDRDALIRALAAALVAIAQRRARTATEQEEQSEE